MINGTLALWPFVGGQAEDPEEFERLLAEAEAGETGEAKMAPTEELQSSN